MPEPPRLLDLAELEEAAEALFGGKAAGLKRLLADGPLARARLPDGLEVEVDGVSGRITPRG